MPTVDQPVPNPFDVYATVPAPETTTTATITPQPPDGLFPPGTVHIGADMYWATIPLDDRRPVIIEQTNHGLVDRYWRHWGQGYASRPDQAHRFTVREIYEKHTREQHILASWPNFIFHLLPIEPSAPLVPGCQIGQVLSASLIEILRVSPQNEIVRTQVHAAILQPIPEDKKTFDDIKAWIEATIPAGISSLRNVAPAVTPLPVVPPELIAVATPDQPMLSADVRVTRKRTYRCYQSERERGQSEYNLPLDRLRDIALRSLRDDDGWDYFISKLVGAFEEMAQEETPDNMETVEGSDEVYDHDEIDDSPNEYNYEVLTRLTPVIQEFLQQHDPELLSRLRDEMDEVPF